MYFYLNTWRGHERLPLHKIKFVTFHPSNSSSSQKLENCFSGFLVPNGFISARQLAHYRPYMSLVTSMACFTPGDHEPLFGRTLALHEAVISVCIDDDYLI